jgi:hypothetical protein
LLPNFVIVDTAAEHDNKRARELCADLQSREIVLFDKGYVDFGHLRDLDLRGIFWVTRAKENMVYEVVQKMPASKDGKILRDEVIVLSNQNTPAPELMRRVVALVEIDGEKRAMTFLTNNLEWSPRSVLPVAFVQFDRLGVLLAPANPAVPRAQPPPGGAKNQHAQPIAAGAGDGVEELLTHGADIAQVMVSGQVSAGTDPVFDGREQLDLHSSQHGGGGRFIGINTLNHATA